jgi:hypothetical protein
MTSEETEIPQGRNWLSTIKRLGLGLLVGAPVASLPWLAGKFDIEALAPLLMVLNWPGALVALAFGGWNAGAFTVFLYISANLVFYTGLTYFLLSAREKRKRSNRNRPRPTA